MDTHPRIPNRRAVISAVVAAGVLCVGWLLPSAWAGQETDAGSTLPVPVEQQHMGHGQQQ